MLAIVFLEFYTLLLLIAVVVCQRFSQQTNGSDAEYLNTQSIFALDMALFLSTTMFFFAGFVAVVMGFRLDHRDGHQALVFPIFKNSFVVIGLLTLPCTIFFFAQLIFLKLNAPISKSGPLVFRLEANAMVYTNYLYLVSLIQVLWVICPLHLLNQRSLSYLALRRVLFHTGSIFGFTVFFAICGNIMVNSDSNVMVRVSVCMPFVCLISHSIQCIWYLLKFKTIQRPGAALLVRWSWLQVVPIFGQVALPVQCIVVYVFLQLETDFWRGKYGLKEKKENVVEGSDSFMQNYIQYLEGAVVVDQHASILLHEDVESLFSLTEIDLELINFYAFSKVEQIGDGATCKVFRGTYKSQTVAIKEFISMDFNGDDIRAYRNELVLLAKLKHPNIVKCYGLSMSPPTICVIFEFCENATLGGRLREVSGWSWRDRLFLLVQITRAVAFLHAQTPPVLHRDIKPDNILLRRDWTPVLADFGASKKFSGTFLEKSQSIVGSPLWMAPEVETQTYDISVDLFSLGILMWQVATGQEPFTEKKTVFKIRESLHNGTNFIMIKCNNRHY